MHTNTFGGSNFAYNVGRFRCITDLIPSTSSPAYALDVGCSTGRIAQIVRKKGYEYVGLEISKDKLLKASNLRSKGDVCFLQGDAISLPCKCCFKLVVATEIIEHLEILLSCLWKSTISS